jgi:hypothetical protein
MFGPPCQPATRSELPQQPGRARGGSTHPHAATVAESAAGPNDANARNDRKQINAARHLETLDRAMGRRRV